MTVALDVHDNGNVGTGATVSYTHTPAGTPKGVVVYVMIEGDAEQCTGVTYGGVAMTEVPGSPITHSPGTPDDGVVSAWFRGESVPGGAQSVVASFNGSVANKRVAGTTVTADADTEIIDTTTREGNFLSNWTNTLSLGGRTCFCIQGGISGEGAPASTSPRAGWTRQLESDVGPMQNVVDTHDAIGSSDVTMGWNQSSDDVVCIGVAVSEVLTSPNEARYVHAGIPTKRAASGAHGRVVDAGIPSKQVASE